MIASIRPWPKAPRVCLLERIDCSDTISPDSDVIVDCALSITASRSCSLLSPSSVLARVSCKACPTRWLVDIQPLIDQPRQVRGARSEDFRHGLHASGHFGLYAHQIRQMPLHRRRPAERILGLFKALALPVRQAAISMHDEQKPDQSDAGRDAIAKRDWKFAKDEEHLYPCSDP